MCYNVAFLEQKRLKLEERYKTVSPPTQSTLPLNMSPGYFVSGFDYPLCILVDAKGLFQASWGLIPSWVKDWNQAQQIRNNTLNARAETLFEKASFRKAIIGHRAILPVSGFMNGIPLTERNIPFLFVRKTTPISRWHVFVKNGWTKVPVNY